MQILEHNYDEETQFTQVSLKSECDRETLLLEKLMAAISSFGGHVTIELIDEVQPGHFVFSPGGEIDRPHEVVDLFLAGTEERRIR